MNFSTLSKNLGLWLMLLIAAGCGVQVAKDEKVEIENAKQAIADGGRTLVDVKISLNQADTTTGFGLVANPSSMNVSVANCASGYTQAGSPGATVQAYKYDLNCVVKLNQFILNGMTYNPLRAFLTWLPNDTGTFVNSTNALDIILVVNKLQLNSPITGTEAVSYAFSSTTVGANQTIASSVVTASHALSVSGNTAPNFLIKAVNFEAITPLATPGVASSGGAGVFDFLLECATPQTNSGLITAACYDVTLTDLKYLLVADTYTGVLTTAQADALFTAAVGKTILLTDIIANTGSALGATLTKGGFVTKLGTANPLPALNALVGPNQMHLNPKMILILQVGTAGNYSYLYFDINVSTLTTL